MAEHSIRYSSTTLDIQVYDDGYNPKEQTGAFGGGWGSSTNNSGAGNQPMREELGCVMYASNVLGSRGPRKMQVGVESFTAEKFAPIGSVNALQPKGVPTFRVVLNQP